MDETPPGVLRDKLCKAREGGEYWRKEFIELREFTALEQQLLKVDMEAALVQENEFLKNEVGSLNLIVEKNAGFLEEFSAIFEEKRAHYTQMRSRGGSWTEESELLLDNVVATFDELSLMLETKNTQKADESFTPLDTSVLSTIEEGRESIDSSTTDRIRCKSMDMIILDDSVQQHVRSSPTMDKTFPDDAEKRISELQKVSTLLNSEVAHCMSESDSRDNQITLLEHSLPLANQSLDTSPSELWSLCGKELESLEMTFHNSESNKDEFSAKLENILSLVRKGVGELLSSPKCRLLPLMPECSSANESLAPLADSMYSQQLCSVIFESSVNASAMNMSTTSTHNQDLIRMANDVRSLRNCALNAMSDFSSEMFNAINHLLRLEAILQGAHDGKVSLQEPLSIRYKNALIQDFQDKANRILSSPYHPETASALSPCPSSTSVSVGLSLKPSGSIFYTADDETSQYTSATDGEGGHGHPEMGDFSSPGYLSSIWHALYDLKSTLYKLQVLHPCQENDEEVTEPITCLQVLEVINALRNKLIQERNESFDPNCTEFLSMDASLLTMSPHPLKPLHQNIIGIEDKENFSNSDAKGIDENWGKPIHDCNERLEELTRAMNDLSAKFFQKSADYNILFADHEKLHDSMNLIQQELTKKEEFIDQLKSQITDKECALGKLENQVNCLGADLAIADEKIAELNCQLEQSGNSAKGGSHVADLERIVVELRNAVTEGERHKARLEEELVQVTSGLTGAVTKVAELESSIKALNEVLNKTRECLEVKQKCQQKHLARIQEVEELNSHQKSLLEKLEIDKQIADEKVALLTVEVQSLNDQLVQALAEMEGLESLLQAAQKEQELVKADHNKQLECVLELQRAMEELHSTIEGLEAAKLAIEHKLLAQSKAKTELEEKLKEVTCKAAEFETSLLTANSHFANEADELKQTIAMLKCSIEDLKHSKQSLVGELSNEIRMKEKTVNNLVCKTEEKASSETATKEANDVLNDLYQCAQALEKEQISKIRELREDVYSLMSSVDKLNTMNAEKDEKLNVVLTEKKQLEDRLELVCKELAQSSLNTENLKEALGTANQELTNAQLCHEVAQNEETKQRLELESTIAELKASKCDLQNALNAANSNFVQMQESEEANRRGNMQKLEECIAELSRNLNEKGVETESLENKLAVAEANLKELCGLSQEWQASEAQLRSTIGELEASRHTMSVELSDVISSKQKLNADFEQASMKVTELEDTLQAAKEELKAAIADRNRLKADLKEATNKVDELQASKEEFKNDCHRASNDLAIADNKIGSLESDLAQARSMLTTYSQHVVELESKLASMTVNFNKLVLNFKETSRERDQQQAYLQMKVEFDASENRNLEKKLADALESNVKMKELFCE